ncbi:MAG: isoprenylcysteine carboxylmethyltransferase family protein [Flammeovirgaceae bacterium]|nr:isoprenylcysteine carboxylmethyltransferase family protein [Flammeovirgaceae bacterium]
MDHLFFLHSFLASNSVKKTIQKWSKFIYRFYRLGYSIISATGLLFLLWLNGLIPSEDYFSRFGLVRYASLFVTSFGVIIIRLAFKEYKLFPFLGFGDEDLSFKVRGILTKVRHPIYSGIILLVVAYFLFSPNLPTLLSCMCMLAYLPIGIYLEEKKLISQFGDQYIEYRKNTPALIPRLFS